jgi:hypothetical protein
MKLPEFNEVMLWVKAQPEGTSWPTQNPYECPVAAYLFAQGASGVMVWTDALQTGDAYWVLQPQHSLRRLIVRIDRRTERTIVRDDLLEIGREIVREGRRTPAEIAALEQAARDAKKAKYLAEWGW